MPSIGKTSTGTALPAISAALLLASATIMLLPTQAAAQFNIDGIIRGAIGRGGYGYRGPSHHSSHESSHHDSADKAKDSGDNAADSKAGKGIKSTNDTANAGTSGSAQAASSDTPPPAKVGPSGGPPGGASGGSSSGPSKPSDSDVPTFAPSR